MIKKWASDPWKFHDTTYEYAAYDIEAEYFVEDLCCDLEQQDWGMADLKKVYSYLEIEKMFFDYLDRRFENWDGRKALDAIEELWRKS